MRTTPLQFLKKHKIIDHAYWVSFVLFYTVLVNIPFWVACYWLGLLPLGWVCLEYVAVGLFALVAPSLISAILLFSIIAIDILSGISKTYYLSPVDCITNVGSLLELPASRLLGVAAVFVVAGLTAYIAAFLPGSLAFRESHRRYAAISLVVFASAALLIDSIIIIRETGTLPNPFRNGRPSDVNRFTNLNDLWIGRYPLLRLRRNQLLFGGVHTTKEFHNSGDSVPSATAKAVQSASIFASKRPHNKPNFVLIVVESWGQGTDPSIRDSLLLPYSRPELLARYHVSHGSVPFSGSTVSGEARELCGSNMGFHIMYASTEQLRSCLPDKLASIGYHTLALHGMDDHMFGRSTWYASIGFQEQWFKNRLEQEGMSICIGAFNGICDADISDWIRHRLETSDKNPDFVYWMTLNSHLPVPVPSRIPSQASCSQTSLLSQNPALCSWYQLVSNVQVSAARIAMAKLARPTVFVIVGDHAPPFDKPALRKQFSSIEVPYVLLIPR